MSANHEHYTRFDGIARLYGRSAAERLRQSKICIVGIGGVGSWAAEALARCGIGAITLVDLDEVCASNINRQLPALTSTVGRSKVEVMRERILEINPECRIDTCQEFFTAQTAERLLSRGFDACLDAIDDVPNKALLIARCRQMAVPVVAVGGAGGRKNPAALRTGDLSIASHDRLLQRVRKLLRSEHQFPSAGPLGVPTVYSVETATLPEGEACEPGRMNCNSGYGSVTLVTGTFGFAAGALIVSALLEDRRK